MSTFNELIDFTRSTTGTYLDSVVLTESVTNGDFDAGTNGWAEYGYKASVSATGGQLTVTSTGVGNGSFAYQKITAKVGTTYIVTVQVSTTGVAYVRADTNISTPWSYLGSTSFVGTANETKSFTFVATEEEIYIGLGTTNASAGLSATYNYISVKEVTGGQVSAGTPLIRTAAINEPRLEYDTSGNPLGLLIEEARTNLFINSIPTSAWTTSNTTLSFNVAESPDGQATAGLFAETATGNAHMAYQAGGFNFVSGTAYTSSVYVKANTATSCQLTTTSSGFGTTAYANFDLSNGTLGTTGASATSSIQEIGNGWYRISMTATAVTSASGSGGFIALNNNNPSAPRLPLYAGDTSQSIYVWGNQVEAGAFLTSYIPTSGSAATRGKDVASLPVERFAYNQTQGSLVVSASSFANLTGSDNGYVAVLSDGTSDNRMQVLLRNASQGFITGGLGALDAGSVAQSQTTKIAMAVKTNDAGLSLNGSAAVTATSGSIPSPITDLRLGGRIASNPATLCGHIKSIQYYPKRLSNEELQLLTQPSASPTMNLTFDGQATSTLVEGLHD